MYELVKLVKISQKNVTKLNYITTRQENLEKMLNDQNTQISKILSILKDHEKIHPEIEIKCKGKEKIKIKNTDEFYQVNINYLYYFFILFIFAYNYLHYKMQLKSQLMNYFMSTNKQVNNK